MLHAHPCPFATILVCTDGSPASRGAVQAAFTLAQGGPSRLVLLQVLEFNPGFASQAFDFIQQWEREVWDGLQGLRGEAEALGLASDILVRQGEAAYHAILAVEEELRPDLIVLGRHGRTALARLLMGSTTARLIGLSAAPVLVVPRDAALGLTRLLAANDGSPHGQAAWRLALRLAHCWRSEVLAVSVAREEEALPAAAEILKLMQDEAHRPGISLTALLLKGTPAEAIVQAAQAHAVDLIILGSHGHTGLTRLLMGSVAERVIGLAPCPVLVGKKPV